jgi:Arc/MetJ-type ribon-helix-helix transcriptional regulator
MAKQVTVRLPDDLVTFLDQRVAQGMAPSRAAVVAAALERERRRARAERDIAILTGGGEPDDLDQLAAHAASVAMEDLQ